MFPSMMWQGWNGVHIGKLKKTLEGQTFCLLLNEVDLLRNSTFDLLSN